MLVFLKLDAANIAYELLATTGGGEAIGPIVLGMKRPINALQQGAPVSSIVHMTTIAAARAIRLARLGVEAL